MTNIDPVFKKQLESIVASYSPNEINDLEKDVKPPMAKLGNVKKSPLNQEMLEKFESDSPKKSKRKTRTLKLLRAVGIGSSMLSGIPAIGATLGMGGVGIGVAIFVVGGIGITIAAFTGPASIPLETIFIAVAATSGGIVAGSLLLTLISSVGFVTSSAVSTGSLTLREYLRKKM